MADHNKLYDACKTGDLEKVKYLVSNGCNPKADNNLCILYASVFGSGQISF